MGSIKRAPKISNHRRYTKISKASLVEAYIDLYREMFGEESEEDSVFDDLETRIEILTTYRNSWDKADAAPATEAPAVASEPARRPMLSDTLKNAIVAESPVIIKETGERGVVAKVFFSEIMQERQYRVLFANEEYCDYDRDEIEKL